MTWDTINAFSSHAQMPLILSHDHEKLALHLMYRQLNKVPTDVISKTPSRCNMMIRGTHHTTCNKTQEGEKVGDYNS